MGESFLLGPLGSSLPPLQTCSDHKQSEVLTVLGVRALSVRSKHIKQPPPFGCISHCLTINFYCIFWITFSRAILMIIFLKKSLKDDDLGESFFKEMQSLSFSLPSYPFDSNLSVCSGKQLGSSWKPCIGNKSLFWLSFCLPLGSSLRDGCGQHLYPLNPAPHPSLPEESISVDGGWS